jgi:WD40 repeat protein
LIIEDAKDAMPAPDDTHESVRSTVLPLLQFALHEVWLRDHHTGMLTCNTYRAIGALAGALTRWADENYTELRRAGYERVLERLLLRLVQPGSPKDNIPDTRRRALLTEVNPKNDTGMSMVIGKLTEARLLISDSDVSSGFVEFIHDSLLRDWTVMVRLLAHNRDFLTWYRTFQISHSTWMASKAPLPETLSRRQRRVRALFGMPLQKDPSQLLRGAVLVVAQGWLSTHEHALEADERHFIAMSAAYEKAVAAEESEDRTRTIRTQRLLIAVLVAGVTAVAMVGMMFRNKRKEALDNAIDARSQLVVSLSSQPSRTPEALSVALSLNAEAPNRSAQALSTSVYAATRVWPLTSHAAQARIAVSDDGKYVASSGRDGRVRLWSTLQRYRYWERGNGTSATVSLAFSHDNAWLVAASEDGSVHIWAVESGRSIADVQTGSRIHSLAISPSNLFIVVGCEDGIARILDAAGREIAHTHGGEVHKQAVTSVIYTTDGKDVITGSEDFRVLEWNATDGSFVRSLYSLQGQAHTDKVVALEVSHDGALIISGSEDRTVHVYDAHAEKLLRVLSADSDALTAVHISLDNRLIIAASRDGTSTLWNVQTGERVATLNAGTPVLDAVFGENDDVVLSSGEDGMVRIWDTRSGELLGSQILGKSPVEMVRLARTLAIGATRSGDVVLWDLTGSNAVISVPDGRVRVLSSIFSPDSRYAALPASSTIHVIRLSGARETREIQTSHTPLCIAFSRDSRRLIAGMDDGTIASWETSTWHEVWRVHKHDGPVVGVEFVAGSNRIISWGADRRIVAFDAIRTGHDDGDALVLGPLPFAPLRVLPSADGTLLVQSTGSEGHLYWGALTPTETTAASFADARVDSVASGWDDEQVFFTDRRGQPSRVDLKTRSVRSIPAVATFATSPLGVEQLRITTSGNLPRDGFLAASTTPSRSVAVSRDGAISASVNADGEITLWSASGSVIATLGGNSDEGALLAFSPDAKWFASADRGGLKLYDLSESTWKRRACCMLRPDPHYAQNATNCADVVRSCDDGGLPRELTPADRPVYSAYGCADDSREGFVSLSAYPTIAGCQARWPMSSLKAVAHGMLCGNGLRDCDRPADACGRGWHVCGNDVAGPLDLSRRVPSPEACYPQAGSGAFAAALGDQSCLQCRAGGGGGAVCCGARCKQEGNSCVWPQKTAWVGRLENHNESCGDIENRWNDDSVGVLCCLGIP